MRHLYAKLIADPAQLDRFLANVVTEARHFEHDAGGDLAAMVAERGRLPGPRRAGRSAGGAWLPLYALTNFAAPFFAQFRQSRPLLSRFGAAPTLEADFHARGLLSRALGRSGRRGRRRRADAGYPSGALFALLGGDLAGFGIGVIGFGEAGGIRLEHRRHDVDALLLQRGFVG